MSFIPAFQSSTIRRDSLQSIAYHQTNSNNNNNNNSNNNNDSNNNQPSNGGEWIATTERYESINNPFEDQSNNDCHQHQQSQQHQHHQQPLVDPFDGTTSQTRTIIRKLGLKRNSHSNGTIDSKVKLEKVIGLTVSSNAALDCDLFSGTIVYSSGCVLVLYNQRKNKQFHIINSLKKPITSCKFSKDGKYIVTGECGHQPQVRIWEVSTSELIASLSGHKYGINCVAFSPNGKYVVSIGSQHDMMVNVWDWRSNHIVASNKISLKVKSVSFAEQGDYFVTVGNRHVKFWYLEYNEIVNKSKFESFPLMGRNAILGDQRNNYFCDVQCGHGESKESTYVITKSGLLCEFNNRRLLNKWVELKTESAFCITLSQNYICVGCSQGLIRCFRPQTLEFVCTLPRPHSLGVDIAKGFTSRAEISSLVRFNQNSKPKYADTIAVVYDEYNKVVTAIYADRSIYFWSLNDIKRIGKVNSFLFHSSCIWDIDIYPFASKNGRNLLPPGTFLTCSSDDTIRIWNTEIDVHSNKSSSYIYKKNFFSSDLMKILYMDPELNFLCDPDLSMTKNSSHINGMSSSSTDQYDSKNGVRTIKFSTDGKHLASGDRCGNIRIFDLEEQKDLFKIEAHDAEVLCLEYSNEEACGRALLVSASRDRFIHIFDVNRQYSCIQNIEDHSSSITAVKFIIDSHNSKNLQLISCGADKSLIFRKQTDPNSEFRLEHHVAGKSTFFDMAIDQKKNQIVTASQDRFIRSYDVKNGKNLNSFKGSLGDDGALIKIAFDSSATFIATSCTDKSIYIYDYQTGECLAATSGHSEIVTGLKFSQDGRHLISISGDGCIFVWRLPIEMTNAIASKLGLPLISDSSHSTLISNRSLQIPLQSESINRPNDDSSMPYRLNVSTLPTWARKQMFEANKTNSFDEKDSSKTLPRGRWAQRVVEEGHDLMNSGLVKSYASTFESMASKSTPTTPSGINSPNIKDTIKANNRLSLILSREPRAKSSLSSGVEDDDDDRNTTDSDNTYSQESSYKINKVQDRTNRCKNSLDNYSMISSISMANINDLPYDDDAASSASDGKEKDENKNYVSLYMSTENLERIDQRNRYLKNAFENIDKVNIDNTNSASDDSGINQIDHSLSSTTTNGTLTNRNDGVLSSQSQQNRRSISSRYNKQDSASPQSLQEQLNESTSDDATSSDIAEICNDSTPDSEIDVSGTKISTLDTIEESQTNNLNSVENDIEQNKNKSIDSVEKKISDNQNSPKEKDTDENLRSTIDSKLSSDLIEIENSDFSSLIATKSSTMIDFDTNDGLVNSGSVSLMNPISKKREEMAKTLSEMKKKLQSVGSSSTRLTNSKSVCNLRTAISSFPDHRQNHRNSLYGTLSSRKGHTNLSNNIYSGANGGDDDDDNVDNDGGDNRSYLNQSILDFHKSISLSDLSRSSCTLPRKLSVFRRNLSNQNNQNLTNLSNDNSAKLTPNSSMNNYQFAPLWDQRQRVVTNPPGSGQLSRTPSTNALNKAEMMRSQSTLCRQGLWNAGNQQSPSPSLTVAHMKPPIHVNGSMVANVATPMMNLRSGRSSAPPSQFRKSAATISCASSSRRGDSTEDDEELDGSAINSDEENSEEHRAMRPRPVTPPKPNILKQIRRGSSSSNANQIATIGNPMMSVPSSANVSSTNQFSTIPNNNPHHHHYIQNPNHSLVQSARPRRLWSTDTIRSSKSEFNLANIGRDIPLRRRNNSGMNSMLHPQLWPINMPTINNNQHGNNPSDRFDLSLTNPSSIPLSLELCQHLINEMSFLINYASRIHERASNSENVIIVDYLRETLGQASRDIQVIVNRNNQNQISNNKIVENGQNLNSPNTINKQINGGEIQSNRSNDHNEEKRKQSNEYDSDVKNNNSIVSNSFIDQDSIQQEQLFRQFLMFLKMNNGNTTNNGENKSSNNQNNLNDKNLSQSAQSVTLQSNPIESSKMVSSQSKSSSPSSGSISNFNIASVNVNSNRSNME